MYATFCVWVLFLIIRLILCENECGPPPEVDRAIISNPSDTGYVLGSTVTYRCDYGFVSGGVVRKSKCVRDSVTNQPVWTIPEFSCNPRSCGDPGSVENARRVGSRFTFPNNVEYVCNEGYTLSGSRRRYCEASGAWSGRLPTCNAISCERPEDPENGRAVYASLTYNSELRYECNKDLQLSSKEPRYCDPDGQWTGTQPVCQEIECEMPENPDFGSAELIGSKPIVGSIVIYKCDPGRRLIGSRSSKCLKSGEWTFSVPLCTEPCIVPSVANGELGKYEQEFKRNYGWRSVFKKVNVRTTLDENEEVILKCSDSYVAKFSEYLAEITITCRGGQLSPEPECVTTSCYDEPPSIENGKAVVRTRLHGTTVWYQCDKGFEKESGKVQCWYGKWIGNTPTCKDIRCHDDPPHVENATSVVSSRYHEAPVQYICDRGFETVKRGTIKCWYGTWTGNIPICKDTRCDKSSLNYPGLVRSDGFLLNRESFVPSCLSGYEVTENRDRNIYCNAGSWSGNLPPCTRARCKTEELAGLDGLVLEGYHTLHDGDWLQPRCAAGFEFSNKLDSRLHCREGVWQGNLPPCSPAHCSNPPPTPENGRIKFPHASDHGSYVEYECLPLYDMDGTSSVRCNYGQWIGSPPTCKDSRCYLRNLLEKEGVDLTDDGPTNSSQRADIVCIGGYYLRYPEVYCEDGVWKTENVLSPCQESNCYIRNLHEKEGIDLTYDKPIYSGHRANIICMRGYSLTYPKVYCENGVLKAENVQSPCQEDECEVKQIPNGKILKERSVSTEYLFGAITRTKTVREAADIGSTESIGAVLYVECDDEYKFQGEEAAKEQVHITCRRGEWTPLPVCLLPYCLKDPPTPENGRIKSLPSIRHGSSVEYACHPFYKMHGNSSVVCNNGQWTGLPPTCKDRKCYIRNLNEKEGVDLTYDKPIYPGYRAKIVCIKGYSVRYPEVYCEEGMWKTEGLLSPCQETGKPLETEIPNADEAVTSVPLTVLPDLQPSKSNDSTIRNPSTNHSIIVSGQETYSANNSVEEGFDGGLVTLFKSSTENEEVVVVTDATVNPPCSCKYISEDHLLVAHNGKKRIEYNDAILSGSAIAFSCRVSGYFHLRGPSSLMCPPDCVWHSHMFPTCVSRSAGKPMETEIPNADEEVTSVPLTVLPDLEPSKSNDSTIRNPSTNHSITVSGQESYAANNSVESNFDGSLVTSEKSSTENEVVVTDATVNPPCSCKYIIQNHLLVAHDGKKRVKFNGEILSGSTIVFYCRDSGYFRLRGPPSLMCPPDCVWHPGLFPSCVSPSDEDVIIRITSDPPENLKDGPGGVLSIVPGTRLELRCRVKVGYQQHVDLTTPPGRGSKYLVTTRKYQFVIQYVVDEAAPENSGRYTCYNMHGQSHSVDIEVGGTECPEIELTEELSISYVPNRKFGSQAIFTCRSPYMRNGLPYTTCEASGVWSGPPASCQLPTCSIGSLYDIILEGVVPLIDGDIDENLPLGYELQLGCDEQRILKGDNTATCGAGGIWRTGGDTQCVKGCTGLSKKNDSELLISPDKELYSMGESITFSCPDGKGLTTEVERILCFSSGWTPDIIPDCQ